MENGPFTDDFPNKTSIYNGFSIAMLNYQRVPFGNSTQLLNIFSELADVAWDGSERTPHRRLRKYRDVERGLQVTSMVYGRYIYSISIVYLQYIYSISTVYLQYIQSISIVIMGFINPPLKVGHHLVRMHVYVRLCMYM